MNAAYFVPLVGITLMAIGLLGVGTAAWRSHRASHQLDFIRSLGSEADAYAQPVQAPERVQTPLVNRMFGPAAIGIRHSLSRLYPSRDIDRVHADLLKAGLTGSVRAEEFVAIQVGSVIGGFALGLILLVSRSVGVKIGVAILFVLPLLGGLAPSYWLRHRIKDRREQVTNDLPISSTSCVSRLRPGSALSRRCKCRALVSSRPVCHELRLTLPEMELGLSRHDALENMKLRTDIDDLVTLRGRPLAGRRARLAHRARAAGAGRRDADKRRQRPAEKAAKVPVKILFPLAFCFLPAILIIVIGPWSGRSARVRRLSSCRQPHDRRASSGASHGNFGRVLPRPILLHLSFDD